MSRKGRIKIPHSAFETFVNIARKENGDTQELLCYFLGEKGKVDTILLPKQDRKPSSVFDQGKKIKILHSSKYWHEQEFKKIFL